MKIFAWVFWVAIFNLLCCEDSVRQLSSLVLDLEQEKKKARKGCWWGSQETASRSLLCTWGWPWTPEVPAQASSEIPGVHPTPTSDSTGIRLRASCTLAHPLPTVPQPLPYLSVVLETGSHNVAQACLELLPFMLSFLRLGLQVCARLLGYD